MLELIELDAVYNNTTKETHFLNNFYIPTGTDMNFYRIPGVLQRFAFSYFVVATVELFLRYTPDLAPQVRTPGLLCSPSLYMLLQLKFTDLSLIFTDCMVVYNS